ncbi:hypothetical protein [Rubrivirga sp. SAORIC476]|uniref:hypothetical protein n=1 Tax=Rubrivirga sp. SAORIC476 TaxID=1961794 RepID=UPI001179B158|nr:hypothetical protein [Rubrivirga sp. SAORIC476]
MLYHIEKPGPYQEELVEALKFCIALSHKRKTGEVLLALTGKSQLSTSLIQGALGLGATKKLKKDNRVDMSGLSIVLWTKRVAATGFSGPALVPHVAPDLAEMVAQVPGVTDVVFVPWRQEELEVYLSQNESTPLRKKAA